MNKIFLLTPILIALAGCGRNAPSPSLTPMPQHYADLSDEKLVKAVTDYVQAKSAPANSLYDFIRLDLNNDGQREGIILFKLPHSYWCGWDGCEMVIFKADKTRFTLLNAVNNVRGPIYVDTQTTKGWRDIIIRTSGTELRDKNVVLRFDGGTYPTRPIIAPKLKGKISSRIVERFFR